VLAGAAALFAVSLAFSGGTPSERWQPRPGASFQIQLQGAIDLSVRADVYELDGFDVPASTVRRLHGLGRRAVCYVNAGAWERWRPDRNSFPASVVGRELDDWPGERWLDIRRIDVLGPIMRRRFEMCRRKGFDAIEADNVAGYTQATGFRITSGDQLRYNRFLARTAHRLGLSIGLKNDLGQVRDLVPAFDFAVNEECFEHRECDRLRPFKRAGKAVFVIEYALPRSAYCARARRLGFTAIRKRLDLGAWRAACR
jgi:hypothetical protein